MATRPFSLCIATSAQAFWRIDAYVRLAMAMGEWGSRGGPPYAHGFSHRSHFSCRSE
jgi:hypothetical protein